MNNLKVDLEYELELADTTFAVNKILELFDETDFRVYEGASEKKKIFKFKLFRSEEFGIDEPENIDYSILKTYFTGRIHAIDAAKTEISVYSDEKELLGASQTANDGNFLVKDISPGSAYKIRSSSTDPNAVLVVKVPDSSDSLRVKRHADGYFYVNMNSRTKPEITLVDQNKKSVTVQEGTRFSLPAVYYTFNSYYLKIASRNSLDKLVVLMKDNPELRIEIQSHTDSRGPANYNNLLSQKRADGVAKYLETSGIKSRRLVATGKGENELSNRCKDGVNCDESEHAKNRRTEFLILGNN